MRQSDGKLAPSFGGPKDQERHYHGIAKAEASMILVDNGSFNLARTLQKVVPMGTPIETIPMI